MGLEFAIDKDLSRLESARILMIEFAIEYRQRSLMCKQRFPTIKISIPG